MSRRLVAWAVSILIATLATHSHAAGAQNLPAPAIPTDFNLPAAMKTLYGNYDPNLQASTVTLDNRDDGMGPYAVLPFYLHEFDDSGKRYVLMATYAIPAPDGITTALSGGFDCHACTPLVGAALLSQNGQNWDVDASELPDVLDGFAGGPPDGDFFQFGPHHVGLKLLSGYSSMGQDGTTVLLFVPWNRHFSEALFTTIEADDNDGDPCASRPPGAPELPCYSGKTELTFVKGSGSEYYDLVLKSSGTEETTTRNSDHMVYGVRDITGTKRLHFVNGKYTDAP